MKFNRDYYFAPLKPLTYKTEGVVMELVQVPEEKYEDCAGCVMLAFGCQKPEDLINGYPCGEVNTILKFADNPTNQGVLAKLRFDGRLSKVTEEFGEDDE